MPIGGEDDRRKTEYTGTRVSGGVFASWVKIRLGAECEVFALEYI